MITLGEFAKTCVIAFMDVIAIAVFVYCCGIMGFLFIDYIKHEHRERKKKNGNIRNVD